MPLLLSDRLRMRGAMAWLGFTAGAAEAYQNQDVRDWRLHVTGATAH